ncbi:TRAP transporter substrate-binding protein [Achromobacter kerstersii]
MMPLVSIASNPKKFRLKFGNYQPLTHPLNIRAKEMAAKIKAETGGLVEVQIFPNSQLGSDTDMLSQLRAGSIDMMSLSPLTLGILVPMAQISGIGFAFKDYDAVWAAMDGQLGARVRQEIASTTTIMAFEKIWDNGFRQITTSNRPVHTPEDMKGLKMRVPPSSIWTSMFKALDASPTTISLQEVYSALQTKVVDGQENPMVLISASKLYEVQKYCSMSNHMWDGFWIMGNQAKFANLPDELREIVIRNINEAALKQRGDIQKVNNALVTELAGKGLIFNQADRESFRAKLQSAGFYDSWHKQFGNEAWFLLEQYSGKVS